MIEESTKKQYQIYSSTTPDGANEYHFYFSGEISSPENYIELLQLFRIAGEDERIHMYFNTSGGNVYSMVQIINGMRNTNATVITHLEGICHSAGTFMFLNGHEFVVNSDSLLLFHNYSTGIFGKGNELVQELLATDSWLKEVSHNSYYPFLSIEEIDEINKGGDRWMKSSEVLQRLETLTAARQKVYDEAAKTNRRNMYNTLKEAVEQDIALEKETEKNKRTAKLLDQETERRDLELEIKLKQQKLKELMDGHTENSTGVKGSPC